MRSHILGNIELDETPLSRDLEYLSAVPRGEEGYDEFSNGYWKNVPLWNASGDSGDDLYRDTDSPAQLTEHGKNTGYLRGLVEKVFDTDRITMVRARNLVDAVVIPHRDFVELDRDAEQYFRVLMFLEDNPAAFHSNDDTVINMRPGEVWFLDAGSVHAAANFSSDPRQMLCVDFAFDGEYEESDIFRDPAHYRPSTDARVIDRPPLPAERRAAIGDLGKVVDRSNFKEFLFFLSKVHFRFDVPAEATYDWLTEIAASSGDRVLVDKAAELREYAIGARELSERFSINSWN
ncbi:L-proline cis-4-hydroxylase [Streptomyces chumphonensis]|uniref:Aspartyl/asparaginyl beta-hydroxylase domain-containing protein n=1 Tax=Streptomyces chumphonensis TaxID=1214925 RepID=A0A927F0W7_9ACTN|nr:aspartyl/asparaginyl beta-hydroxylase domain-containing protein [Streptomyces chumphonensis]MBD3933113.1 aspartyl/asparaginyl beta-hydroxylase domain-containing protein [Streptomyces chumphonensis]